VEWDVSIRRACEALEVERSTYHYRSRRSDQASTPARAAKLDAAMTLIAANTYPSEAARQLGLGRSTLYREMRRLGISRPG
jgi:transcriptional regulator of acetoin/glycerol metabolism